MSYIKLNKIFFKIIFMDGISEHERVVTVENKKPRGKIIFLT
jgi:hypothetical protein